eukprot:6186770-Pleurochrysis_carterae.AAC.8
MRTGPRSLFALDFMLAQGVKGMRLRATRQQPNHTNLHPQSTQSRAIARITSLRSPSCMLVRMRMSAPSIRGVALISKHLQAPS